MLPPQGLVLLLLLSGVLYRPEESVTVGGIYGTGNGEGEEG